MCISIMINLHFKLSSYQTVHMHMYGVTLKIKCSFVVQHACA